MAQYQVPQFIEVEDKIFGPLTLKQFIYLAGGGGVCLALFTVLPLWLSVPLMLPPLALSISLAFYEVNGRPFIIAMEHAFNYYIGSKLYLWAPRKQQTSAMPAPEAPGQKPTAVLPVPKLSESKLRDLSWSLNIKDRTQSQNPSGFEI